jgi:Na+(H+)/acetate symporter ActP
MTALLAFVIAYLLSTLLIGVYAGTRVKTSNDFALAGRSLPLIMVITTTFATWFGAETVLGISAKFVTGGLGSVVEDPFGASMCLIFVGIFFAGKLYKMNLLTIGDFYRQRYGKTVEILCSVAIILSYLGWVAAQITALGLVFSIVSQGAISPEVGMAIGTLSILIYVMFGGMLAVAWTDFIQMITLVIGLSIIAYIASEAAGGAGKVVALAHDRHHHDARVHSPARCFPESDVGQERKNRSARCRDRWAVLPGFCLRPDVHSALCSIGDARGNQAAARQRPSKSAAHLNSENDAVCCPGDFFWSATLCDTVLRFRNLAGTFHQLY